MQLITGIMIGILIASVGWAYLAFRINKDWYIAATESDERWAKFCHMRKYYGISAQAFKKMLNITVDEALQIAQGDKA